MEKEFKYTVFEHNENASPEYIGCRFYTGYIGEPEKEGSKFDIVGHVYTSDDARALIKNESGDRASAFISGIPKEIMTPDMDLFIRGMIND